MGPHPEKLADEAVDHRSDNIPAMALMVYENAPRKEIGQNFVIVEAGTDMREESDSDDDQESGVLYIKEENEYELLSPHLAPVIIQNKGDSDDKAVNSTPGVLECSLPCHSDDSNQGKKLNENLSRVKKSQQRMLLAKQWIKDYLLLVATSVSMVSLENIEKAYINSCQEKGQEPLNTFVLARLIHQVFPEAVKCRRGSRGSQKIHYRKLQWRSGCSPNQDATLPSENNTEEKIPSEELSSAEAQSKDENAPPQSASSEEEEVVVVQKPRHVNEQMYHAVQELVEKQSNQPVPKGEDTDEKGCQDAAQHFTKVVKSVKLEGKFDLLLKIFAHSASCSNSKCNSLCLMFRRVRRHVVNARHPCSVMRIYSVLLKLHVARCNDTKCGMTTCPALQASRQMKRGRDEDFQDELQQQQCDGPQRSTKRPSLLIMRNRMPSPAGSLPDSQPNTPSPPPALLNLPHQESFRHSPWKYAMWLSLTQSVKVPRC
ncbi:uncharacterized protein LOC123510043 isoform X2 [Portunus trituberculatus]|uniref:uncharacterized protein LOC123510043 isoform X2 n=1 Tax=Portunus trituberculatus TaxID=210409 RepID=UPI001E1CE9D3|nr:uncharacterized protein LOC123510043 isoform X2 [Portunus trituberculatus]